MKKIKIVGSILCGMIGMSTLIVATGNALNEKNNNIVDRKQSFYEKYVKRPMDFFCASSALVVLSPIMATTAVLVRIDLGSPVIFKQERIGKNEKPFMIWKFRSMKTAFDENGIPLPDDQRLTKFGQAIRKLSIDELPSLVKIIKGEMSVVGPRPLPTNYLPWFTKDERQRHSVRGGLTGLAQINGRNTSNWEDRFKYDIEYVNNISFITDVRIVLKTVKTVLERKDIGTRGVDAPQDFHVYRSGCSEQKLKQMEK